MKIFVCSDSHCAVHKVKAFAEEANRQEADLVIHLGDCTMDARLLNKLTHCPVTFVGGNCDFDGSSFEVVEAEGHRILCVHGNEQSVNSGLDDLLEYAKGKDADAALYGHTHIPMADLKEGIWLINPGSLSRPRSEERVCTYCILEVTPYRFHYTFKEI